MSNNEALEAEIGTRISISQRDQKLRHMLSARGPPGAGQRAEPGLYGILEAVQPMSLSATIQGSDGHDSESELRRAAGRQK
jgi:hypothetical protein